MVIGLNFGSIPDLFDFIYNTTCLGSKCLQCYSVFIIPLDNNINIYQRLVPARLHNKRHKQTATETKKKTRVIQIDCDYIIMIN